MILEKRRSEEHTSELQSHSEISYAVFCLKKKKTLSRSPAPGSPRFLQRIHAPPLRVRGPEYGFFFLWSRRPPRSTLILTRFPYTTLFRSCLVKDNILGVFLFFNAISQHSIVRSEEHTSELQSHSEISYAVFCLKKKKK